MSTKKTGRAVDSEESVLLLIDRQPFQFANFSHEPTTVDQGLGLTR